MKKIWIWIFFSLFVAVAPCFALEIQGKTITSQEIQNLPPGTIESLPPGTLGQVKQAMSADSKNASGQDAAKQEIPTSEIENAANKLFDASEQNKKTAKFEPDKTETESDGIKMGKDEAGNASSIE